MEYETRGRDGFVFGTYKNVSSVRSHTFYGYSFMCFVLSQSESGLKTDTISLVLFKNYVY